jgi:hypothetical protein
MNIPFDIFIKVKHKYCLAYLGNNLSKVQNFIPKDQNIYLAVNNNIYDLLEKRPNIIKWEETNLLDFAHIEIKADEYIQEILK